MKILQGLNRKSIPNKSGFALVDVMLATFIGLTLMASIYAFNISQQKAILKQEQIMEMDQNLRFAVDSIVRDLKNAGYDPKGVFVSGSTIGFVPDGNIDISNEKIRILSDLTGAEGYDGDGTLNDDNERVIYSLNKSNNNIYRSAWSRVEKKMIPELLSENISDLQFNYYDSDGVKLATPVIGINLSKIRLVEVSVTATTELEDPDFCCGVDLNRNLKDGTAKSRTITTKALTMNVGM